MRLDERGIALVKVLFLTSILLAVAAYASRGTRVEIRIAQNDYLEKRALGIAEAGLDRAWRQVQQDLAGTNLSTELGNSTGFMGSGVGSDATIDGVTYRVVSFGGGEYRVRLVNNSDDPGPNPSTTDNDGKILISSIGIVGGSQRELESLLEQSGAFDTGLFAKYALSYSGTGSGDPPTATDSYNSSTGIPYESQTPGDEGNVGTNGSITGNGQATINGDATAGGSVDSGNMTITGDSVSGAPQVALPPVTPCNTTIGYSPGTGIDGVQGNSIRATGNTTVYLPPQGSAAGTYTYCFDNVSLSGNNTSIVITQPVILYTTGYVDIQSGVFNEATPNGGAPIPANFQIYSSCVGNCGGGSAGIKLTGGSTAAYVVYAPEANIQFSSNGGDIFGAVIGGDIKMSGGVNFHYDEALDGTGPTVTALVSWHEVRND